MLASLEDEVTNKTVGLGLRIKFLRKEVAKVKLLDFAEKALVNKNTLSLWENGKLLSRPIQDGHMSNLIKAFKHYGIEVTERWLRTGEGQAPIYKGKPIVPHDIHSDTNENLISKDFYADKSINIKPSEEEKFKVFIDEIKLFTSAVKQSVVTKIDHSEMLPMVDKGDWVGGIWEENPNLMEERICILELISGQLHVALVKKAEQESLFQLRYFSNMEQYKTIQTQNIIRIAPVVRIWR